MIKRIAVAYVLLLAGLFATPELAAQVTSEGTTTIMVVRHAEKMASEDPDPPLTELGHQRASALIDVAREAKITAIYSTPYRRTQSTAAPVAAAMGIPVTTFQVEGNAEQHSRALANDLLENHAGKSVLVVGHSNTVPAIVRALGGSAMESMTESEYDHLLIVVIPGDSEVRTIHARYGPPGAG